MYHRIEFIGRLGRDPEMRYTPQGQAVTNLSVACDRQYINGAGDKVKETIWYACTCWGKTAEAVAQYCFKGQLVFVEGRLTPDAGGNPRIWANKDGEAQARFEVTIGLIRFLEWKDDSNTVDGHSEAHSLNLPKPVVVPASTLQMRMQQGMSQGPSMTDMAKGLGGVEDDDPDTLFPPVS